MYKRLVKIVMLPVLLALALPAVSQEEGQEADAPVFDDGSRSCINTRRIRQTYIVDDRNVLFYMRGGVVYHNILRRACNGLEREGRFSYHTTGNQLCRLDTVNVLYDHPWGLREGIGCLLGDFHEISEEAADAMREAADEPPEAQPLPLPEPEEIGAGGGETGEEAEPES